MTRAVVLAALAAMPAAAVTVLPAGKLLHHPAHYFDLSRRWVRFTPAMNGDYTVRSGKLRDLPVCPPARASYGHIRLPFPFPFAGQSRTEAWISPNGALTFEEPEAERYPELYSWPDGTMRSVASRFDVLSIAGRMRSIVPLWGANDPQATTVHVAQNSSEFVLDWDALRIHAPSRGYAPLGRSHFQLRLTPDGAIEFRYGTISERDGIAGIFPGNLPPVPAQTNVAEDLGSVLRFRSPAQIVVAHSHGDGLAQVDTHCLAFNVVGREGRNTDCFVETLRTGDLTYMPKIAFRDAAHVWWQQGADGPSQRVRVRQALRYGFDLSAPPRTNIAGNVYEVFHYPHISKGRRDAFRFIYSTVPPSDDLGIVFTDFRVDDLHNVGAADNVDGRSEETSTDKFSSPRLESAAGPVYLGPLFSETVRTSAGELHNYASGVWWMAHELLHRWLVRFDWPGDNKAFLRDSYCQCHWNERLRTPVVAPVSHLFTSDPYPEASIMGGTTDSGSPPWGVPAGVSALDLYAMGLLHAADVAPTHLGDTPVRIEEVQSANKPVPYLGSRTMSLGVYLIHQKGRPVKADKLRDAEALERMLIRYFDVATQGRLKVVPSR